MRSSDLFVVRVLWRAGTALDCYSAIERSGKRARSERGFLASSKAHLLTIRQLKPAIIAGMTGEPILLKKKYRLFLSARSIWTLENSIQIIKIIHTKEEE
jgi:hypothetical protein